MILNIELDFSTEVGAYQVRAEPYSPSAGLIFCIGSRGNDTSGDLGMYV